MTLQEIIVDLGYTDQFNDAWHKLFDAALIPSGSWNDRMSAWLTTTYGYTGSLSDKIAALVASYI